MFESRDEVSVTHAMDKTFPERRRMLVKEVCPLSEIFATYPILHGKTELFNEFTRATSLDATASFPLILEHAPKFLTIGVQKKIKEILAMKNEIIGVYDQFQHLNLSFIAALLCVPLIIVFPFIFQCSRTEKWKIFWLDLDKVRE